MTATTPAEQTDSAPEPAATAGSSAPAWLPLAAVGVTLVLWASAFVAIRHLAGSFSPGALSLGRLLVGSVCLGVVALSRGLPRPTRGQWVSIVTIGVLWFGIYNVALNAGEQHVDAGTAVMLIQVSPVLVALLAATFLHERFTTYLALGLALAFAGVALIATASDSSGDRSVLGVVLCLLAAVVYSISLVLQKPLVAKLPAIHVTWLACTVGAVVCLPFVGQLVDDTRVGVGVRRLVGRLPRRLPDRDRVHDVRLRAAHHVGEQPGRDDLPRPADHDPDGLALPRRDPARDGLRRRRARAGRRRGRPAQAAHPRHGASSAQLTSPTGPSTGQSRPDRVEAMHLARTLGLP